MNAPKRQMSSTREILFSPVEEEELKRLNLRLRYLWISSRESAIVFGSSCLVSRAGASSSLLMDRMCINKRREDRFWSPACADVSHRLMYLLYKHRENYFFCSTCWFVLLYARLQRKKKKRKMQNKNVYRALRSSYIEKRGIFSQRIADIDRCVRLELRSF